MTTVATQLLPDLAKLVGAQHTTSDPATCAAFAVHGQAPGWVVAPGSPDELAAVLRLAAEHQVAVVPWGGGTQQLIGAPLTNDQRLMTNDQRPMTSVVDRSSVVGGRSSFVVLRTTRLNRVLIHEPADLTISVEAGMTLGALRSHLEQYGQMLPIDPPLPEQATIGGLIATAADGPRRLGYGTLRDLLIGIAVADTSGQVTKAGGMVVKNVSGFDMMKLYLGSFGTLAVVVSANFKLLPAPRAAASLVCRFAEPGSAFACIDALHQTQLTPSAAEYLDNLLLLGDTVPARHTLVLRAEGLPAAVARHMSDLADLARQHGSQPPEQVSGQDDQALWAQIADLPQTADAGSGGALLKFSVLPGVLAQAIGSVTQAAAMHQQAAAITARALNGVFYARLQTATRALLDAMAMIDGFQWAATALADAPRWGQPAGIELMRRFKAEFDPTATLNPGRFVV